MTLFKAYIDNVDVSSHLKGVEHDPGGDGYVGSGRLYLDQEAGGLDIRTMMDVKVWETFNDAGAGVAPRGRMFGGVVKLRDTSNIGVTKIWALDCWDYNVILRLVSRDAATAKAVTLTANTFKHQIESQLIPNIQENGHGDVAIPIDAQFVTNLHASMPAVTYEGGHELGWYIQQLCITAQSLNTALRPIYWIGTASTDGALETFGNPTLYIFDAAVPLTPTYSFSDTAPAGGRQRIYGEFKRVTDASGPISQRRQALYGSPTPIVITSQEAASQVLYPCPYINHGDAGFTGKWMLPVLRDTTSTSQAAAQAALDRMVRVQAYPRDTYEFETYLRIVPGETIGLGWALESIAEDTEFRVAKVTSTIEGPGRVLSKLTVNNRRLGLLEDNTTGVYAPPTEGDPVPPLPPVSFTLDSNVYNPATGLADMAFTIGPSPSPDVAGYVIIGFMAGSPFYYDAGTLLTPTISVPSGVAYSLWAEAYDTARNLSGPPADPPLTGTTATPVWMNVPNPSFEEVTPADASMPRYWDDANNTGGGVSAINGTEHVHGNFSGRLTVTTGGDRAGLRCQNFLVAGNVEVNHPAIYAKGGAALTLRYTYTYYDAAGVQIGSPVTGTRAVTTAWVHIQDITTVNVAGAASVRMEYYITHDGAARTAYIDLATWKAQEPTAGLQDGAVDGDKLASAISYDGTFGFTGAGSIEGSPLIINDSVSIETVTPTANPMLKITDGSGAQTEDLITATPFGADPFRVDKDGKVIVPVSIEFPDATVQTTAFLDADRTKLDGLPTTLPYDFACWKPGMPSGGEILLEAVIARDVTINNARVYTGTPPAADVDIDVRRDATSVGVLHYTFDPPFSAWSCTVNEPYGAGSRLTIVAPGTPDVDMADIAITLMGELQ